MTRPAVAWTLCDGTEVVLAELTPSEMLNAAKLAGSEPFPLLRGMRVGRAAVRLSLREVNGKPVTQAELAGGVGAYVPRTREQMQLAACWAEMHLPTETEAEAVEASMTPSLGPEGERWTVTIPARAPLVPVEEEPAPRVVVLAETSPESVEDALRAATLDAKSEAAQDFAAVLAGCARSVRSVDGKPVTQADLKGKGWDALFSVRETHLLGRVYRKVHGLAEMALGEARPVPRS